MGDNDTETNSLHAANESLRRENEQFRQRIAELEQQWQQDRAVRDAHAQHLIDHIAAAIFIHYNGRFRFANPAAEAILGYTAQELTTLQFADFVHPDFLSTVEQRAAARQRGEVVPERYEIQVVTKMGDTRWIDIHNSLIAFMDEPAILTTFFDVTERKHREEALHLFKTLADFAPDGIATNTLDGTITYANASYQAMHGYGTDIIGLSNQHIIPNSAELQPALQHLQEHGCWQGTITHQRRDGSTFPVMASVFTIYDEAGQPRALAAIDRDVTERQQQENELKMFKLMVESSPDALNAATMDGYITYANPASAHIYGYKQNSLIGKHIKDLMVLEHSAQFDDLIDYIKEHGIWQDETLDRRADGSLFPTHSVAFLLRHDSGEPYVLVTMTQDRSLAQQAEVERMVLQQQVIDAQRDALRELSTPLIPITDNVVIMPLIGTIDSQRAQMVLESLLEGVARHQARLVILDITGVSVVDTQVAQTFIQAAQAVKLLGAQVMLTGIQPQIAQTLVQLGVNLRDIQTWGSLQAGIAAALHEQHRRRA